MKKLEKRALMCIVFALILVLGLGFFVWQFATKGVSWATFYANRHIYSEGRLAIGSIYDVNGKPLLVNDKEGTHYNDDEQIRRATVHVVGDGRGNISTSAQSILSQQIVGYNLVTGTYSFAGRGRTIKLTIDSEISKVADEALGYRDGLVGIYNYQTGDILCMVSHPNYDPVDPPTLDEDDDSGIYMNKFLSSTIVPGSIFKLLTAGAAIENMDVDNFSYYCPGTNVIDGEPIRCTMAHGQQDFDSALANSCNGAFAEITNTIGADVMKKYVKKAGLTSSYDIDGIKTAKGHFDFPDGAKYSNAWAGIGQHEDLINPCSYLVYVGAIANGGKAAMPRVISNQLSSPKMTEQIIKPDTAARLDSMMKNNVESTYGEWNFRGLDIYAKSGTAELEGRTPHAWFTGYIRNDNCPYAFIVCVENGGYGSQVAGPVAKEVMQAVVEKYGN